MAFCNRFQLIIALDLIYSWLPLTLGFIIHQFWTVIIFYLGIVMIVYGLEAVGTMGGKYWEMWYFTWENGQFVFMPNFMPKKYAISIVPISGLLVCIAAIASIVEDSIKLRKGIYTHAKDMDTDID